MQRSPPTPQSPSPGPHLCGIGGDLFALVHIDDPAPGRPRRDLRAQRLRPRRIGRRRRRLRAEGLTEMPFKLDVRSVTVPGCIDGWIALHDRFGSLPLDVILAPARRLAAEGFRRARSSSDRFAASTPRAARTWRNWRRRRPRPGPPSAVPAPPSRWQRSPPPGATASTSGVRRGTARTR